MQDLVDEIMKCVAFVAARRVDGTYRFLGSMFFIGTEFDPENKDKVRGVLWVTARHVIDGAKRLGVENVHVRLNLKDGTSRWTAVSLKDWFADENDETLDAAVALRAIPSDADHIAVGPDLFLRQETHERLRFGVTDEVLVVGLFRHRTGNLRNVPIGRMGTIASVDSEAELVSTKLGEMPAYLIEARSIGGLSGSPVFVLTGTTRQITGKTKGDDKKAYLLGLIHGHFDVNSFDIDGVDTSADLTLDQINTGIAIVTPFRRLFGLVETYLALKPPRSDVFTFSKSDIEPQ